MAMLPLISLFVFVQVPTVNAKPGECLPPLTTPMYKTESDDWCEQACITPVLAPAVMQFGDVHFGRCDGHGYPHYDHTQNMKMFKVDLFTKDNSTATVVPVASTWSAASSVCCVNPEQCLEIDMADGFDSQFWKDQGYKYDHKQHPECSIGQCDRTVYPTLESNDPIPGYTGVAQLKYGKPPALIDEADCSSQPFKDGCACGHKWECASGVCAGSPPTCGGVTPPAPPTPPPPPTPSDPAMDCEVAAGEHYLSMELINPTDIKVKVKTCDAVSVNGSTAACQGNPLKPNWYLPCGSANDRVMPHTTRPIHFHSNVTYIVFSNGVGVKSYYKPLTTGWPTTHRINIAELGLAEAYQAAANVSIYKIDYPVKGACGEEINIEASNWNPHYFFPIHFGGFKIGTCDAVGYQKFLHNQTVEMNPVPGITHNLTFQIWGK